MTEQFASPFTPGQRVQVVDPVVWQVGDTAVGFLPGEDLYVLKVPADSGQSSTRVRCSTTGAEADLADSLLVAMPPYGETMQKALQRHQQAQQTLMGTVVKLQDMIERREAEAVTKDVVREHGPEFINIVFDGPPGPDGGRFIEVETDDGRSLSAGEWLDYGPEPEHAGWTKLRIPYGGRQAPEPVALVFVDEPQGLIFVGIDNGDGEPNAPSKGWTDRGAYKILHLPVAVSSAQEDEQPQPDVAFEDDDSRSGLRARLRHKDAMITRINGVLAGDASDIAKLTHIRNIIDQG
jgi:hypothetical protein